MRVCFLNDNYYRGSGITLVIERLLRTAAFAEVDVLLAGCSSLVKHGADAEEAAIAEPEQYASFALMQKGPGLVPELFRFAEWLRERRCDLVHVHHRRLAMLANLVCRPLRIPVLFTGHLTFPGSLGFKLLAPDWATGVSPSVVAYLRRATRAGEIHLLYNPLDFGEDGRKAQPPVEPGSPQRVISIGRLDPVKGHAVLIEAWKLLKDSGIAARLDIYGEGPLRASLQELIDKLGLEQEVRLCGFAPDVQERIGGYAFNVLVSETEGFPNAVVEAASRRVPSLLTNVEGTRDTIPPGLALPNGLPYGDARKLSAALGVWLASPELVAREGVRFHDFLKACCDPETVGAGYVGLYRRMLRKPASSPFEREDKVLA